MIHQSTFIPSSHSGRRVVSVCQGSLASTARQGSVQPMRKKTVLITGGNTGIGYETAKDLLRQGHDVILGCRDENKGKSAKARLEQGNVGQRVGVCDLAVFDLADTESVRDYTKKALDEGRALDVLLNNAGVMACPLMRTSQGFEQQIGAHYCHIDTAPFYITGFMFQLIHVCIQV